ncbi:MAG: DUF3455 domain-containing protein [Pyrinomonadaceae bacterium]
MKNAIHRFLVGNFALLLFLGFSSAAAAQRGDNRAPKVPDEIAVPDGNRVHFHGFALGVQIYTWNGSSWGAAVPEATLFDDDDNVVASHFAVFDDEGKVVGRAWESNSGSRVVGDLPPLAAIVDTESIPWLRLGAVAELTYGPGVLANTTFIHRVNTVGGKAPKFAGTVIGQVARVPYTADYFFYRKTNKSQNPALEIGK